MAVRGTSPSLSQTGQPRMLRVEFRGQPYDWFSLDEMGDVVRSEDFSNTLRENIAHYFSVPYDCQAIFDEDGLLTAPIDFVRSLQRPQPYLRVFDVRELPDDLREQGMKLLAVLGESVERAHKMLTIYPGDRMPAEPVAAPSPAPPQPPPQSAAAGSGEPPLPSTPPPPASATAPGGAGDGGALVMVLAAGAVAVAAVGVVPTAWVPMLAEAAASGTLEEQHLQLEGREQLTQTRMAGAMLWQNSSEVGQERPLRQDRGRVVVEGMAG
eukprot:CAMPEP_0206606740 /NCGR_PEP_ID=MMETSP0325_2-20121206/51595_1 /ASSEMBLY_ACC=CAM_ASM_000347 /TAXON_ID=2866 /ORGANISM="Crypthecodinium cohnii, Strain Seligo" /LENGTH=267 /DNA_ID=CAMNT_0054123341 /DNA_START=52 /DNA_END=853 /DNA_ORIENTATION=-